MIDKEWYREQIDDINSSIKRCEELYKDDMKRAEKWEKLGNKERANDYREMANSMAMVIDSCQKVKASFSEWL